MHRQGQGAAAPYEFGVKVSVATTLNRSKGGQFIAHVKALPGNPYGGHTLAAVIPEMEAQIGACLSRIVADRGYRGTRSISPASGAASPTQSSATCAAARRSNPSSVTPRPSTVSGVLRPRP